LIRDRVAAVLSDFEGQPVDFVELDCVRLGFAVVAAVFDMEADDVAAWVGMNEWSDEASAFAAVEAFGVTLGGCMVKAASALGLTPARVSEASVGAVGLAAQRGVLGATLCVLGPDGWMTATGPEGLVAVPADAVAQAWSAARG